MDVLFICTGNVCRSPMAEAYLRKRFEDAGFAARVHSAGLLNPGLRVTDEGLAAMRDRGIDTSAHRSRRLAAAIVDGADLVVGMAREHVREAVLTVPEAWPKAFTLKELARRGEQVGPRTPGQPLDEWLDKLHAGRERSALLGSSPEDDVEDPIGMSRSYYERTAAEICSLVDRVVELAFPGV